MISLYNNSTQEKNMSLLYTYVYHFWAGSIPFETTSEQEFREYLIELIAHRCRQRIRKLQHKDTLENLFDGVMQRDTST